MKKIDHIAIIDDDPIVVFGLRKLIATSVDCELIESFGNGKLAYDGISEKLEENRPFPTLIFLDINMPIMDGWEFLKAFIALPISDRVKINIVTSSIDPFDREQWEQYQEKTHHLITFNQKPITKDKIEEITEVA